MGKTIINGILLTGVALVLCGCNSQDAERLGRVSQAVAVKFETWTGSNGKLLAVFQALRGGLDPAAADARVRARLRWDKSLADTPIEVNNREEGIELKGAVHDLSQRRRAVELAGSTVGTEKIIDLLEVPEQKP